jgi:glycosyltransferase involved in cell wall biosynthesis
MTYERKLLTIAIPTFNRNAVLYRNLGRLLPQIEKWVDLIIIDNCSDVPVCETIELLCKDYPDVEIKLYRNSANIGGNANVLRCIEFCESEYIWIIGDDDFPSVNALKIIKKYIEKGKHIWLNFYSDDPNHQPVRKKCNVSESLSDFLVNIESISELVFVSNNIFRTTVIKNGLETAHMNQSMMAPHLISMLAGIEKINPVGIYITTGQQLFDSISNNEDLETSWPLYRAFLGIMSMYRLDLSKNTMQSVLRLIAGSRLKWLNNRFLYAAFSRLADQKGWKNSFRVSSGFFSSLFIIDRGRFFISAPLFIIAVLCGPFINRIVKR